MDVTPWLESADWIGGNMSDFIKGEHMANPRVFKSHLPYGVRFARLLCTWYRHTFSLHGATSLSAPRGECL